MKKSIYVAVVAVLIITAAIFIETTQAKYRYQDEKTIGVSSTPFYFTHSGQTAAVPYNSNTANVNILLENFIDNDYTEENITYQVKISNPNYNFSVDGESSSFGIVTKTMAGGDKNNQTINVAFSKINTTNIPDTEDITVTITTTFPYSMVKTYTVTIYKNAFSVQGNPTNWINTDVTLTVVPFEGITLTEYSYDNGVTWNTTSTKTYTTNTANIQILAKDSFGQICDVEPIDIVYIDKVAPIIVVTKTPIIGTLNESKNIMDDINISDTQSGVNTSLTTSIYNSVDVTNVTEFANVGRYNMTISATDNAGNTATSQAQVLVRWPTGGKYVLARQTVSTSEDGLFADNVSTGLDASLPYSSKYYYRGKNVNNYVTFSGATWRIISVPQNDTVKIMTNSVSSSNYKIENSLTNNWDDTDLHADFNEWAYGNYISSHSIAVDFTGPNSHAEQGVFYVGAPKRVLAGNDTLLSVVTDERTNTSRIPTPAYTAYIGLMSTSEYIKACNSSEVFNIRTTQTRQSIMQNNDWIYTGDRQWTINAAQGTSSQQWLLYEDELLSYSVLTSYKIRPTIFLKENTILSGTGTLADPFTVQENWDWFDNSV